MPARCRVGVLGPFPTWECIYGDGGRHGVFESDSLQNFDIT